MDSHIKKFLDAFFASSDYSVIMLAGDASARKYHRVIRKDQSMVLMQWEPYDINNYPFTSVLTHFANNNIFVPQIIQQSPSEGLILLEDLGDLTLERKFWENQNQDSALDYYQKSIDELIKIHYVASAKPNDCTAFKIQFDVEKFLWEMKYGQDNLLTGICKFNFNEKSNAEITSVFKKICTTLHEEPKYIAHRDYHARNLMIKLDRVRVIDFQDARMGPVQYDLVSLVNDSYVNINEEFGQKLISYYLEQAEPYRRKDFSREHFDHIYEIQTIQRCFKACGSFSSFYIQRGDTRYLKYIAHTLRKVLKSLALFPEYKVFADILIDSGALERKYEAL